MQEPPIDWRGNAFRKAAPFLFAVDARRTNQSSVGDPPHTAAPRLSMGKKHPANNPGAARHS